MSEEGRPSNSLPGSRGRKSFWCSNFKDDDVVEELSVKPPPSAFQQQRSSAQQHGGGALQQDVMAAVAAARAEHLAEEAAEEEAAPRPPAAAPQAPTQQRAAAADAGVQNTPPAANDATQDLPSADSFQQFRPKSHQAQAATLLSSLSLPGLAERCKKETVDQRLALDMIGALRGALFMVCNQLGEAHRCNETLERQCSLYNAQIKQATGGQPTQAVRPGPARSSRANDELTKALFQQPNGDAQAAVAPSSSSSAPASPPTLPGAFNGCQTQSDDFALPFRRPGTEKSSLRSELSVTSRNCRNSGSDFGDQSPLGGRTPYYSWSNFRPRKDWDEVLASPGPSNFGLDGGVESVTATMFQNPPIHERMGPSRSSTSSSPPQGCEVSREANSEAQARAKTTEMASPQNKVQVRFSSESQNVVVAADDSNDDDDDNDDEEMMPMGSQKSEYWDSNAPEEDSDDERLQTRLKMVGLQSPSATAEEEQLKISSKSQESGLRQVSFDIPNNQIDFRSESSSSSVSSTIVTGSELYEPLDPFEIAQMHREFAFVRKNMNSMMNGESPPPTPVNTPAHEPERASVGPGMPVIHSQGLLGDVVDARNSLTAGRPSDLSKIEEFRKLLTVPNVPVIDVRDSNGNVQQNQSDFFAKRRTAISVKTEGVKEKVAEMTGGGFFAGRRTAVSIAGSSGGRFSHIDPKEMAAAVAAHSAAKGGVSASTRQTMEEADLADGRFSIMSNKSTSSRGPNVRFAPGRPQGDAPPRRLTLFSGKAGNK